MGLHDLLAAGQSLEAIFCLGMLSAMAVILSGLYVLARGEWRPFKLKFAGVALSTVAGLWMALSMYVLYDSYACGAKQSLCITAGIYHVVRNVAFVIFHIAVGRDAIRYKQGDRRGGGRICKTI